MIEVRLVTDPLAWQAVVDRQPLQPFLQSWTWGDFQSAVGRKVWRLGAFNGSNLVGVATIIEHRLLLDRSYLYCPRGPLADTPAALQALLKGLRALGTEQGAMYVKADLASYPFSLAADTIPDYVPGTTLQPRQTIIIDVSRPPSDILTTMHQKTRYNIRLSEKRGVRVRWSTADKDFSAFLKLIHSTYDRQGIRLHPDEYYRALFQTMRAAGMCELAVAEHGSQAIAANLVIWHAQTATYLHGGSAEARKDLMAPHLTQWRTIERAHDRGCTAYDLWGIAPENQARHKWAGVTRFKKGFGGHVEVFPPAVNGIINQPWYWAYRLAKRVRGGVDE